MGITIIWQNHKTLNVKIYIWVQLQYKILFRHIIILILSNLRRLEFITYACWFTFSCIDIKNYCYYVFIKLQNLINNLVMTSGIVTLGNI